MMPQTDKHRPQDIDCPCVDCMTMRLTYALLVARNRGDIRLADFEKGLLILSTYLSAEVM